MGFDNMLGANYFRGVQEYLESKKCEVFVPRVSMVKDINYRASQLQTQIDDYLTRRNSRKERSVHLIGKPSPFFRVQALMSCRIRP